MMSRLCSSVCRLTRFNNFGSRRFSSLTLPPHIANICSYWARIPGIEAIGTNLAGDIVVHASKPDILPSEFQGTKIKYVLSDTGFQATMGKPDVFPVSAFGINEPTDDDLRYDTPYNGTISELWKHSKLYAIGFNQIQDKYYIYGPKKFAASVPRSINGKGCGYVECDMFVGCSGTVNGHSNANGMMYHSLLYSAYRVYSVNGVLEAKVELDSGEICGITSGHTVRPPSFLPSSYFHPPNTIENFTHLYPLTGILYDTAPQYDDSNKFFGYCIQSVVDDDLDIGIVRYVNSAMAKRDKLHHISTFFKDVMFIMHGETVTLRGLNGSQDLTFTFQSDIQNCIFTYQPYAPLHPKYATLTYSGLTQTVLTSSHGLIFARDQGYCDLTGRSGSILWLENEIPVGILIAQNSTSVVMTPFTTNAMAPFGVKGCHGYASPKK